MVATQLKNWAIYLHSFHTILQSLIFSRIQTLIFLVIGEHPDHVTTTMTSTLFLRNFLIHVGVLATLQYSRKLKEILHLLTFSNG